MNISFEILIVMQIKFILYSSKFIYFDFIYVYYVKITNGLSFGIRRNIVKAFTSRLIRNFLLCAKSNVKSKCSRA